MIELEKTYLAKEIPKGLSTCEFKEIIDIFLPKESRHPCLRIRKNGNKFEMTKKKPVNDSDTSCQEEQTIKLTENEFAVLNKVDGKKVHKLRYLFNYENRVAEVDIFQGDLKGLVVVDFEFDSLETKESFSLPSFCLTEVTQEEFIAGGMVCGKSYRDLEDDLNRFGYKKLFL
jgi:CYTH domain-containing protein